MTQLPKKILVDSDSFTVLLQRDVSQEKRRQKKKILGQIQNYPFGFFFLFSPNYDIKELSVNESK